MTIERSETAVTASLVGKPGGILEVLRYLSIIVFGFVCVGACAAEFLFPRSDSVDCLLLPLYTQPSDTALARWSSAISLISKTQLEHIKSVRLLPGSSARFAFKKLRIDPDEHVTPRVASSLAELINAGLVVQFEYTNQNNEWSITANALDARVGGSIKSLTGSSPDLYRAIYAANLKLLKQFGIQVTHDEHLQLERPPTSNLRALELLSLAFLDIESGTSDEAESKLRLAVELDDKFAAAWQALASLLTHKGRNEQAIWAARHAVSASPDSARAHFTLACAYTAQGSLETATHEFLEVTRLDPHFPDSYQNLATYVYAARREWQPAVASLVKAKEVAPYDALIHASLGCVYAYKGDQALAVEEIAMAENLFPEDDILAERALGEAYALLNDPRKAIKHYEKFLEAATDQGLGGGAVSEVQAFVGKLKARITPVWLDATSPPSVSLELLHRKITTNESKIIPDPFSSSPELNRWADQATQNCYTDIEKAKGLFDALLCFPTRPEQASWIWQAMTAAEAFNRLSGGGAAVNCQDYTFIYIAAARHLGIRAYAASVERDCAGRLVLHTCPAVFYNGKALLVDVAYQWFGAPHQKFEIEDDIRAIAILMSQTGDRANSEVGT